MLPSLRQSLTGSTAAIALLLAWPVAAQSPTPDASQPVSDEGSAAEAPASAAASSDLATAPVSEEGAAALQMNIKETLATWFPAGETGLTWTGEPEVTADDGLYVVSLPDLTADTGVELLGMGRIGMALIPFTDGTYQVELALPDTLQRLSPDTMEIGAIEIGGQQFSGIWNPDVDALTSLTASYDTITVTRLLNGESLTTATIGSMGLVSDATVQADGLWSGISQVSASGVNVLSPDGRGLAEIAELDIAFDFSSATDPFWVSPPSDLLEPDPASGTDDTDAWFDGATATAEVSGLSLTMDDGTAVSFADATLSAGLSGLSTDSSSFTLGLQHDGLTTVPPLDNFNPDRLTLDISAVDLPNATLGRAVDVLARMLPSNPQAAAMVFAQQVAVALGQASSQILIEDLSVDTPTTDAQLTGGARFTPRSVIGLTADFDLVLRGVEDAMKVLAPPPGQSMDDTTQMALAVLGMLQALGQTTTDESGAPVRTYKIQVTAEGRATINGADLSGLLGGMAPRR